MNEMDKNHLWGIGKLSLKSTGMWPEHALQDLKNARALIDGNGGDMSSIKLGGSKTVMLTLNGLVPDTDRTWRRFFEEENIAYCYIIEGLTKRSALVSSLTMDKTFLSIPRTKVVICEITDIDRKFKKLDPEFMADMEKLYSGVIELTTGINTSDLKGIDVSEHK